jgi:hypothetical protein
MVGAMIVLMHPAPDQVGGKSGTGQDDIDGGVLVFAVVFPGHSPRSKHGSKTILMSEVHDRRAFVSSMSSHHVVPSP